MNDQNDIPSGAQRKLAAIMFTDMVGYSALMQKDESLAIGLLDEHCTILRSIFPVCHGREIETIGDAFLVEFDSAINAARCAIAIQEALEARNKRSPGAERILVRIGVHLGDIVRREKRVYGDGVNVASRIQEQAGPGEILVSDDVARQLRNAPDIPMEAIGERALKNIVAPVKLFRVGPAAVKAATGTGHPGRPPGRSAVKKWLLAGVALAFVTTAILFLSPFQSTSVTRNSVAVLPFRNLSADKNDEYFAEGITEDVIAQVSRIGSVRVINSQSISRFRSDGMDRGEIARALDVETILEGSIQRDGEKVKITVHLVEASTGEQLWGQTYKSIFRDIFAIQEEIARGVAGGLQRQFFGPAGGESRAVGQSYVEAYDLYLKGRYHWNRRTPAEIMEAMTLFGQAAAKDSTFALAHVGLADCYAFFGAPEYGVSPPAETFPQAETAVNRAIGLDETLAEAHATLGSVFFNYHWDWKLAEKHFRRAIELNPNYANAYMWYADCLTALGRFDEAHSNIASAIPRDPLNLSVRASAGVAFYYSGKPDSALAVFRRIQAMDTAFVPVYLWLGLTYTELGRYEEGLEAVRRATLLAGRGPVLLTAGAFIRARMGDARGAREVIGELENLSKEMYVSPYYFGEIYHALGENDVAFRWFERAVREKSGAVVYMKVSPTLKSLRGSREFTTLLESAGLR